MADEESAPAGPAQPSTEPAVATVQPPTHAQLEVDEGETDSALGDDTESTTTSLAESIYAYRQEHGRTYHAYKDGAYWIPNDDRESDRLDLQHHMFSITLDNKLFLAPIAKAPRHCLDIGTGTGIWAVDFADEFPNCEVIGTDLSPTQPQFVPPNLRFIIDDAEDPWLFGHKFDLIHARLMAGCFRDWRTVMQSAFEFLEPGGYMEIQDYIVPPRSHDGTFDGTALAFWAETLLTACRKLGRPMDVCHLYREMMEEIGFVDIEEKIFVWPQNTWPKQKHLKEIGRWNEVNLTEGMEGFSLALMTRALGWSKQEVEVICAKVRNDLKDRSIHAYFPIPVIYGRKPL